MNGRVAGVQEFRSCRSSGVAGVQELQKASGDAARVSDLPHLMGKLSFTIATS